MEFRARLFDRESRSASEKIIEATDLGAAERELEQSHLVVLDIRSAQANTWSSITRSWTLRGARAETRFDVRLFCQEVRTLLVAGMSLVEAIETLLSQARGGASSRVLQALQTGLFEGRAFSTVLASRPSEFPAVLVAAVTASERTGRVPEALAEYLRYDHVIRELRRKVINAGIYPALVVGFGLAVTLFLLVYVVPRFAKVYDEAAHNLSESTALLIGVGRLLNDHAWEVGGVSALLVAGVVWAARSGLLGRTILAAARRFKSLQNLFRIYQLARIYQTMCMLLRGGYTVLDAAALAQNLAFQDELSSAMVRARTQIAQGKTLSFAFGAQGLTDTISDRLLKVGERSGNFDVVLDTIAQRYTLQLETIIERLTRIVEPLLMVGVGAMIGVIIVLMYMPIFDLASQIQ